MGLYRFRKERTAVELKPLMFEDRLTFVPLQTPLMSTDWDPKAFSTEGPSLLDLYSVFGVPRFVKAILLQVMVRDSVTWGSGTPLFACGPSATYWYAMDVKCYGGDIWNTMTAICPTNDDGNIFYKATASGTLTLDAWLRIFGYWIGSIPSPFLVGVSDALTIGESSTVTRP